MTCKNIHQNCWLWEKGNKHCRYLRFLVTPVSLDLSTWTPRHQCWLRFSRPSAVNSVGSIVTFSLPSITLWLVLQVMNMLLYFTGRVIVLGSTGSAPWMPWYGRRRMVKVTDLTWLLMMGVTWLLPSTRVRRQRNCSSRMVLSLIPYPRTMLNSIFFKSSSSTN